MAQQVDESLAKQEIKTQRRKGNRERRGLFVIILCVFRSLCASVSQIFRHSTALIPVNVGVLLMIGSAASWGMGTVMSKYTLDSLPPMTLLVVQLCASVGVLWLITLAQGAHKALRWRDVRAGWTGILEPGLAYTLGIVGLTMTSASNASLIGVTEPIFVTLIAAVFLREVVRREVWALILVAVIGTALVTGIQQGGSATWRGDLLEIAATASASLYVILSRRSVETIAPIPLAALQQTAGLLFTLLILPLALAGGEAAGLPDVPMTSWLWAGITGIVQYALAFSLYLSALRYIPVAHAALYLTLIPIFGVGGSALLLSERLSAPQLVGALLIIGALVLLTRRQAQTHSPSSLSAVP
jgi:drug/metabolite transporter (DMT)-like permease